MDPPATADSDHSVLPVPPRDPTLGNTFIDPQDKFWSLYLNDAEKYDKQRIESWKGDTDGILIFTGLFAATVATFVVASYDMLSPDSNDDSEVVALLAQLVALSNGTQALPVDKTPSIVPTSAIWINSLWFGSLFVSLSCALAATLVQQWARRYSHDVQRRGPPRIRGPIHVFLTMGVRRFGMNHVVASVVSMLHLAVGLFFAGLVIYMSAANSIMAYVVAGCMGAGALVYLFLSVLPLICPDSPFSTPCTPLFRVLLTSGCAVAAATCAIAAAVLCFAYSVIDWDGLEEKSKSLHARAAATLHWAVKLHHSRLSVACDIAQAPCLARETYAFRQALKNVDEVHELEAFCDALVPIVHPAEPSRLPPDARVPIVCYLLRDARVLDGVYRLLRSRPSAGHPLPQAVRNRRLVVGLTLVRALFKALPHAGRRPGLVTTLRDAAAPLYHTWLAIACDERRPDTAFLARCFLAALRADVYAFCAQAAASRSETLAGCRALALRLAQLDPHLRSRNLGEGLNTGPIQMNEDGLRTAATSNYCAFVCDVLSLCMRGQNQVLQAHVGVWLPMLVSAHQKALQELQNPDDSAFRKLRDVLEMAALNRRDDVGELVPRREDVGYSEARAEQENDRYQYLFARCPELYAVLRQLAQRIGEVERAASAGWPSRPVYMMPNVPETAALMSPWTL